LRELVEPQFVTLTVPNVPAHKLRIMIKQMLKTCQDISQVMRKRRGIKLVGLRKLETTYAGERDDYHPHFHFIIEGREASKVFLTEWLARWPQATRKAQDIRPADDGALAELFKYFTKVTGKTKRGDKRIFLLALDNIMQATNGLRTFQPFGLKREVSEDVTDLEATIETGRAALPTSWSWHDHDWIDHQTGELLTGWVPSPAIRAIADLIVHPAPTAPADQAEIFERQRRARCAVAAFSWRLVPAQDFKSLTFPIPSPADVPSFSPPGQCPNLSPCPPSGSLPRKTFCASVAAPCGPHNVSGARSVTTSAVLPPGATWPTALDFS
jgi:hypothetical protein